MQITTIEGLRAKIGSPHPSTETKKYTTLNEEALEFINASPFLVMTTSSSANNLDASPKGDQPGFVIAEDNKTLLIPDRPGNKLADGHLNILDNPTIGLIFFVPNTRETLRINGSAELIDDADVLDRLAARGRPALLATRVKIEECFFHCGKALIRSKLWQPESWPEKGNVSFGKMFVKRSDADPKIAALVDAEIEKDYQENL
jgi:PPOX class probable FMN-dependent enzyme